MTPLESYNPPALTEDTEPVIREVHGALNDIDRKLFPPVEALRERHREIEMAYTHVAEQFASQADSFGLADWLRYTVMLRRVMLILDDAERTDEVLELFELLERLGHPTVDSLISVRMTWANRLADVGRLQDAQAIGKRMLADVAAYRARHSDNLGVHGDGATFEQDAARFYRHLGI